MSTDPIVAEVRRARDALSAKLDYDVAAIVRDARKRQKRSKRMAVSLKPRRTQVATVGKSMPIA